MNGQFSADDIESLLRSEEKDNACQYCGSSFKDIRFSAGCRYCVNPHRDDEDFLPLGPPLTKKERKELTLEIIANKNANYPGGYEQWCDDRGIKKEMRYENA